VTCPCDIYAESIWLFCIAQQEGRVHYHNKYTCALKRARVHGWQKSYRLADIAKDGKLPDEDTRALAIASVPHSIYGRNLGTRQKVDGPSLQSNRELVECKDLVMQSIRSIALATLISSYRSLVRYSPRAGHTVSGRGQQIPPPTA